jgi:hypothetical protein
MLALAGNYFLQILFGGQDVAVDFSNLKEFIVVQDINKLVPEFKVQLQDGAGILTHLSPFGKTMSNVVIRFGDPDKPDEQNIFDFKVYRRLPEGQYGPSAIYDIRGLLDVHNLFAPNFCRGFRGSIADMLVALGKELGVDKTDISATLNYVKAFVQPNWCNRTFFNYLERELVGSDGDGGYNIFIKVDKGKSTLVCRSHKDIMQGPVKYKFMIADDMYNGHYPIVDYQLEDNYMLMGAFGNKNQQTEYVDYYNTVKKVDTYPASNLIALTDYVLVDGNDTEGSDSLQNCGRTTEFNKDFGGRARASLYGRLMDLSKMWALTWGLPNICPGDVVDVKFAHAQDGENLARYQFAGLWTVERVVHSISSVFRTRLLLRRSGIDTDIDTTLIKSTKKRR